jgi:hypothetical protein
MTVQTLPVVLELHGAVLVTVKRLLVEMDLDERVRRQLRLARDRRTRHPRPDTPSEPTLPTEEQPTQDFRLP